MKINNSKIRIIFWSRNSDIAPGWSAQMLDDLGFSFFSVVTFLFDAIISSIFFAQKRVKYP